MCKLVNSLWYNDEELKEWEEIMFAIDKKLNKGR